MARQRAHANTAPVPFRQAADTAPRRARGSADLPWPATLCTSLPPPPARLAHGSVADCDPPQLDFGQYRCVAPLAQGAMGAVYRAEHLELRREVAIKVIHPRLRRDSEAMERFIAEARATSRVLHPNVVTVYDFGHGRDGAAYLVMELLSGETLASKLTRERRLATRQAIELTRQLASAFAAVHAAGVVHRDLKPDNVFLASDPLDAGKVVVKLLDFGVAKLATDSLATTGKNSLVGTPHYMAPEQSRCSREADPRSDIYSLGCMLYEMLCGQLPFAGDLIDVIMAHRSATPVPPRQLNPEVSAALEALVLSMLAKSPTDRPCDMLEVERRLQALDPNGPLAVMHAAPTEPDLEQVAVVPVRARRRAWPVIAIGAITLAGAALGALLALA